MPTAAERAALRCSRAHCVHRSASTNNCVGKNHDLRKTPLHFKTPRGRTVKRKTTASTRSQRVDVSELRGRTLALDGHALLHRGALSCAEQLGRGRADDALRAFCGTTRADARGPHTALPPVHRATKKGTRIKNGAPVATKPRGRASVEARMRTEDAAKIDAGPSARCARPTARRCASRQRWSKSPSASSRSARRAACVSWACVMV